MYRWQKLRRKLSLKPNKKFWCKNHLNLQLRSYYSRFWQGCCGPGSGGSILGLVCPNSSSRSIPCSGHQTLGYTTSGADRLGTGGREICGRGSTYTLHSAGKAWSLLEQRWEHHIRRRGQLPGLRGLPQRQERGTGRLTGRQDTCGCGVGHWRVARWVADRRGHIRTTDEKLGGGWQLRFLNSQFRVIRTKSCIIK